MKKLLLLVAAAWVVNELLKKPAASSGVYAPAPDRLDSLRYSSFEPGSYVRPGAFS